MDIHVVSFKGIAEVAFRDRDDLAAYLREQDTNLEKVREDMEANPVSEWDIHAVDLK